LIILQKLEHTHLTGILPLLHNIVVVFTSNNARILHNPENLSAYAEMPNAVVNPDLTSVIKIPPHLWQLKDGKVMKLGDSEIESRIEDVAVNGTVNTFLVGIGTEPDPKPISFRIPSVILAYTGLIVILTIYILRHL
jgi:hypothetical protein